MNWLHPFLWLAIYFALPSLTVHGTPASPHLPLMDRTFCWYWLFSVRAPLVNLSSPSCDPCIHITKSGQGVTWIYCTHFSCQGRVQGTCTHDKTAHSVCQQGSQYIHFDLKYSPNNNWLEVWSYHNGVALVNWIQIINPNDWRQYNLICVWL